MKTASFFSSKNSSIHKLLCISILIFFSFSCEKDDNTKLDFEFIANEIIYYPDKRIYLNFNILLKGDKGPYTLNWIDPDTLNETGPYSFEINKNLMLDFEILDENGIANKFTYEILIDSIDSLKYDYRNSYIGTYSCNASSSYEGKINYFLDTLKVVKNESFNMLNILTGNDIEKNYEGDLMTYINSNGYHFYGYHSGVSFSNDSLHYSKNGPLGYYYKNLYKGVKIDQ